MTQGLAHTVDGVGERLGAPSAPSADKWVSYADAKPDVAGLYEWRVPSQVSPGLVLHALAHFRERGAGFVSVLSPDFDHWDGYRVHVPPGISWRGSDEKLPRHKSLLLRAEGVDFEPCPFCHRAPTLNGLQRVPACGVVISDDFHRFNSFWLECCAWAKTPRYDDPRKLRDARAALLTDGALGRHVETDPSNGLPPNPNEGQP